MAWHGMEFFLREGMGMGRGAWMDGVRAYTYIYIYMDGWDEWEGGREGGIEN